MTPHFKQVTVGDPASSGDPTCSDPTWTLDQ